MAAGSTYVNNPWNIPMPRVVKSVLVPYSARQMFDLVDDVPAYPEFLPWCSGASVLAHKGSRKTARIEIDYRGVRAYFTTDNTNVPGKSIVVMLKDGPFRQLHGEWRFRALAAQASKAEFALNYEFATVVLEGIIGPVFNHIASTFIDAFVRRAEATCQPPAPG
jgi:ribosome-associated toxin RatA of RatAB toxin-antitoxin module